MRKGCVSLVGAESISALELISEILGIDMESPSTGISFSPFFISGTGKDHNRTAA